jgi:hypothetical protein
MDMSKFHLPLLVTMFTVVVSAADRPRGLDPYAAYECALKVRHQESTRTIKQFISAAVSANQLPALKETCVEELVKQKETDAGKANWLLFIAEIMKSVGDYQASSYYRKATRMDDREAAMPYFHAEYLRNFRGAQEPLYPQAEQQYVLAQRTLNTVTAEDNRRKWDAETQSRIYRSLVALHQRNGLALALRSGGSPLLSFASIFRLAQTNADLDRTSDIRDYTAAAAFSQIVGRKGGLLTRSEYRSLIRSETPVDTFDRLRFRYGNLPVVDLIYNYRHTTNVAPKIYNPPFTFVPLQLNTWGINVAKPFSVGNAVDVSIEGSFQQSWRTGLIEYVSDGVEHINQFGGKAALSRFIGPDKLNVSMVYVYQAISPDVPNNPNRERRLLAPTISYQFFRPSTFGEHFQTRGIELFGGALLDRETYPVPPGNRAADTTIRRRDFFGGIAARGVGGGRWDFTLQPTFFSSVVRPDRTQDNSQYRTNVVLLRRIVDEEKTPGLPHRRIGNHLGFLHLVFPLQHDVARTGISAYRNYKAGVELDTMWYTTARSGVTFLGTFRYDFQRFYALDKNQNLFAAGVSMGF